jgi:hypothetical protein
MNQQKISFVGQPPLMDFSLVKLNGGTPNLVDMQTGAIYGLGPGELVKMTADIGETLKNSLNANLDAMAPQDSVRIQIVIHSNSGIMFLPPHLQAGRPGLGQQANFILTGANDGNRNNIISARPKDTLNQEVPPREILIVGGNQSFIHPGLIDIENQTNIKHATIHDNEDDNGGGADIIAR